MHIGLGGWSRGAADPDPTCFLDLVRRADALVDRLPPLLTNRRRWAPQFDSFAAVKADFLSRQAIVGAPDRCVEQIGRLVAETGIGHLRCVFNGNGTLDRETTLAGMDLFAREVLRACRHILPPAADSGAATR